jgi:hypothetical protein
MSNTNAPFGFRRFGISFGTVESTGALLTQRIAYNYSSTISYNDPVKEDGSGNIIRSANGDNRPPIGIFRGCSYLSVSQGRRVWSQYWPGSDVASTEYATAFVDPINGAPPKLFLVQSYTTACTRAYIGLNADLVYTAGTPVNGVSFSACSLDVANAAVTAALPFRIRGLYSEYVPSGTAGTDDASLYNIVVVSSNTANDLGIA